MKPGRAFLPPRVLSYADWAKKIVIGDFTGDGKPDFAVLHWETGGRCVVDGVSYAKGFLVRIFINNTPAPGTDAIFTATGKLEYINDDYRLYDMYPNDIAIGDVNGDGRDDIIVANAHSDRLYVYLSNGDGTFRPPIQVYPTGNDDPSYIAVGNFSGSGHLDIAVLNTRRYLSGFTNKAFEVTFSFLFGNGDGTFQSPISRQEGVMYVDDAPDGGLFYASNTFQMTTLKRRAMVGGALRDVVSLNGVLRWWDGTEIQTEGLAIESQFRAKRGTYVLSFYSPTSAELAKDGGRSVLAPPPSNPPPSAYLIPPTASDTTNLDRAWLGYVGKPLSELFSGQAFLMEDFDNDSILDLVIFSEEIAARQGSVVVKDAIPAHHGQRMLVLFGTKPDTSPLQLPGPGADTDLVSLAANGVGQWHRGHRAWRAASADFDMDGFRDILTLTNSGVLLHANIGKRAFQFQRPVIQQLTPSQAKYEDTLEIIFRPSPERDVIAALFRPSGAPSGGTMVLMYSADGNHGRVLVPDEEALSPGKYDIFVYDGVALSSNSLPIEIIIRPIQLSYAKIAEPKKNRSVAILTAYGWFGTSKDFGKATFVLENAVTKTQTGILGDSSSTHTQTESQRAVPVRLRPGPYNLIVSHPTRGQATFAITLPSYAPVIHKVGWANTGGGGGSFQPGDETRGHKLRPGGQMDVEASFVYAPDTQRWKFLDEGGRLLVSGYGHTRDFAFATDNENGGFTVNPVPSFPPGKVWLQLITTEGLVSDPIGPILTEGEFKPPAMAPGEQLWFIRAKQIGGRDCSGWAVPAVEYDHDDTDPRKWGALQKVKASYLFPDEYTFKELTKDEFESGSFCP